MEQHKIGSVVIVQNRRVVGILTERDFGRITRHGFVLGKDRAKDHMTKPVVTVRSDSSLEDVIKLMRKKHVRHVPVLDRRRRLVGIISSRDLLNIASNLLFS
jgi:CBS domain-containing protein